MSKLYFKNIHLVGNGPEKALGELECRCMQKLWEANGATVRDVRDSLVADYKDLSFNSVMTIMNRLVKKGLLRKHKIDGAYYYTPTLNKDEFSASVASTMIHSVVNDPALFSAAAFTTLSDSLDKDTIEKLKKFVSKLK